MFFVRFTSADGELVNTFELTPWLLPAADGACNVIRCYFDRALEILLAEVAKEYCISLMEIQKLNSTSS